MATSRRGEMDTASHRDEQRPLVTACHVCGSGELTVMADQVGLKGVTSDCKPWPRSMALAACRVCGLIQKPSSPEWLATIAEVYEAYTIYHQSPGAEQAVFDGA